MFDVALEKRCEFIELRLGVQGFESLKEFKTFKPFNLCESNFALLAA
jgi:hypothetical protein